MNYDIGIIGGAGPIAGSLFYKYIIEWYQRNHHAWQDREFPSIVLVRYPFSDMLLDGHDKASVTAELKSVVSSLHSKFFVIACNTLHHFGEGELPEDRWIHLMKITAEEVDNPLVLCTSTSRHHRLHQRYFDCDYPSEKSQMEVDNIIHTILKGTHGLKELQNLERIIKREAKPSQQIVLGCTELSVLVNDYPLDANLVDPALLATETICSLIKPNFSLENPS